MLELAPGADPSHQRVDRVTPSARRAFRKRRQRASWRAGPGQCCGGFMRRMSREVPRRYMAGARTSLSSTGSPPCTDARRPEESRPLGVPVGAPTGTLPPGVPREALPFLADTMGRTRLRPDERWGAASRGQMSGRSLLRRRQTDLFHHRRRIPIIGLAADLSGLQLEDARAPHR